MDPQRCAEIRKEILKSFPMLKDFPPLPWNQANYPKSDMESVRCKALGNDLFKKGEYKAALEFYNASLSYATTSVDFPQLYGNRSAVYFHIGKYALAIENIELARKNGFPPAHMARLDAREEKCKKLMEEFGPDRSSDLGTFLKLSHPANEKIPFIVDCMELRTNQKYGRHIVTTKELKTGDIIAIESPAFAWPSDTSAGVSCFFCTKTKSGSLFPCSHCTSVMFCSEECKEKSALFHLNEEFEGHPDATFERQALKMQLEAFRIAGGVIELLDLLKDSENKTIFDFDFSNPNDASYEKKMLIALNGLCKNSPSEEMIASRNPTRLLKFPPINEKPRTAEERKELLKFIISQIQLYHSNMGTFASRLDGIFLFKSLLNHSCLPNVYPFKCGNKLVSIVTRPVKAGEQMFCSYKIGEVVLSKLDLVFNPTDLPFKCECESCVYGYNPHEFNRKDPAFIKPKLVPLPFKETFEQFKKNCQYIDKNYGKFHYEVAVLMSYNMFWLFTSIVLAAY